MNPNKPTPNYTNALIHESSPYLLQHAHNPVNWYPWGDEALQKAKSEDKPILVSIGYAACHWCHVMEHESFENPELAELMNDYFVCIKVDREERPDIDDVYMNAVQLMGQQGGWPLNVFLTPDQKPFWGGTYFPPTTWESVLIQLQEAFQNKREKVEKSAERLTEGLNSNQQFSITIDQNEAVTIDELQEGYKTISSRYDSKNGGMGSAPKFPMPSIYRFLLHYHSINPKDEAADQIVHQTLKKMAYGGIYDQVGGGFARYATDERWLIPHFEKMLYDNAQLISLYSDAYRKTQNPLYKDIVFETIDFCERELLGEHGNFFSSLDADSEGEEGKFYVWTREELSSILEGEFAMFASYYDIPEHDKGNWEGNIILERKENSPLSVDPEKITDWKSKLLEARSKRIRPGLDDKTLTGWNGLMLKGLCDAYMAFGNPHHLELALANANFIHTQMTSEVVGEKNGVHLKRNFKQGRVSIEGFLEDYATTIEGYLALYEVTFDEIWLDRSEKLIHYVDANFKDSKDNFYFFTDINAPDLIARKKEVQDNVIPSSNSVMSRNLLKLGTLLENQGYIDQAHEMGTKMKKVTLSQTSFMANWGKLLCELHQNIAEIVITGPEYQQIRGEFQTHYIPDAIFMGSASVSKLPLMKDKVAIDGKTTIYVCFNKTCKQPVHSVDEALKFILEK